MDAKLRATLVKKDGVIFNNRYEGNPKAGKVKVPVRDTEVAVADYSKTDGAGATHGDTSYIEVTVDKDKAVNEIIDGFDAAAVPDNLVADRLDSAAYSLSLIHILKKLNDQYDRLYGRALIEIEDITDPEVRVAISRRSFDGWSWAEVAQELSPSRDAETVRMVVNRYFKENNSYR